MRKIITWQAADEWYCAKMDALREDARSEMQKVGGKAGTACWELFLRVWTRKRLKGRRAIRKALFPQTRAKTKGPVSTRNP